MGLYRITAIESKDENTYNISHDLMRNQRCGAPMLTVGERGLIRYETRDGDWHSVLTSDVISYHVCDNGDIDVETANTHYHFTKE